MSSAIKILEDLIDKFSTWRTSPEYLSKEEFDALDEAIVKIKRFNELEKWLVKEIKESEKYSDTQEPAYYYEKVLELMK
mgnify:CR=1 FL=1